MADRFGLGFGGERHLFFNALMQPWNSFRAPKPPMKFALSLILVPGLAWAQPAEMVLVPAGEFQMGTDDRDRSDFNQRDNVPLVNNDARPRHSPTTGAFYLDKTEVTNAQYLQFCEQTQLKVPPHWKSGRFPPDEADFPVVRVTWFEANAYAKWAGKRLPTETEWEKAARGTDARLYPWGNDWDKSRLVWDDGPRKIGSLAEGASPFGALDMAGNVAEWTSSWLDAYPGAPAPQPSFGKKIYKVARGGAWYGSNSLAQTWYRQMSRPNQRSMWIGFRCAKDAN